MNTDELAVLIKGRRSIRAWQDKSVAEDLLVKAIELATWAPSGGNRQPWRFYITTSKKVIGAIADATRENAKIVASWPEAQQYPDFISMMVKNTGFFRTAPAAIAVAANIFTSPLEEITQARKRIDARARRIVKGRGIANSRVQSVSAAISYLLLILHQMGLGAVWMVDPLQVKTEIEKIMGIPDDYDLIAFIPVGYPAETPPYKGRKPVEEVVRIVK